MGAENVENNAGKLPDLELDYSKLYDDKGMGVIPAVILEDGTNRPLMAGFMNRQAFEKSMATGLATFWTRTRQALWTKGETSGNSLIIQRWLPDCDNDIIVAWVKPLGPVCHRETETCFDQVED